MPLSNFLRQFTRRQFSAKWEERRAFVIPNSDNVKLTTATVRMDGTVMYADLSGSTNLVDDFPAWFCAAVFKSYLFSAARIIRVEKGEITSYDGDRIMAVFKGPAMETRAVRSALKINWAVHELINPAIEEAQGSVFSVAHKIGIDSSQLHVAKTGIRGSNDLVWIGRAANYAAKLSALSPEFAINITDAVLVNLDQSLLVLPNGDQVWTADKAADVGIRIHRTNCTWPT